MTTPRDRALVALRGDIVAPPAVGFTFVPLDVLTHAADPPADPPAALAQAVRRSRADFAFVSGSAPWAGEAVEALYSAGAAAFVVVGGVLWPALSRHGVSAGLRMTGADPSALAEALDDAAAGTLATLHAAIAHGADAVVIADDLAGSQGPIVPPDFVTDELVGRWSTLARAAHGAGSLAILHSDGDVRALLPAVARAGFDAVHMGGAPDSVVESMIMGAHAAGLTVLGGVPTPALEHGPARAAAAGEGAGILAAAGRFLVADDGGVTTREHYDALLVAFAAARGDGI